MQKKTFNLFIPLIIIVAIIPLLVSGRQYNPALANKAWYSTNTIAYDFFLFWKSRSVILVGILILLIVGFGLSKQKIRTSVVSFVKDNFIVIICFSTYFVTVFFSAVFAENRSVAFWGGYEQFEGAFVLFTYVLLCFYSFYIFLNKIKKGNYDILIFFYTIILIGTGIVSSIGLSQFFGVDFFGSEFGKGILRLMEPALASIDFNFNFEVGRVYLTLYNPNYVGTYVALLLPIVLGGVIVANRLWKKTLLFAIAIFLTLSLIGSESMTGYIAIISAMILLFVLLVPMRKTNRKIILGILGICAPLIISVAMIKPDVLQYAYNKVAHPPRSEYAVEKFESLKGKLFVYSSGKKLEVMENPKISDVTFKDFKFTKSFYTDNENKQYEGYEVKVGGFLWNFVLDNGEYKFINTFHRIVPIRDIPSLGFEKNQHFGSRRGYIWSRTIPLIKEHILIGAGPDHFVMAFPNDDFVGLENNNYRGNVLTKPHNMYMQIAVQTGFVSLIAFLIFYLFYFFQSIKLYFKIKKYGVPEITGISILLGTFGYMVTGITNDSTITVAPIFWTMIGVGLAINQKILK